VAVDVGNGYLMRRRMQNAADAGALAGAYALCKLQPATTAAATARDFMQRNGVDAADIGSTDVKITGGRVDVRAATTSTTFLAGLLGQPLVGAAADASATCGRATSACGLWPVAFELALYESATCGERIVIWNADNDDEEVTCKVGGVPKPICDCYDCDLDNNGANDIEIFTGQSRGWLDFSEALDPLYPDTCKTSGCGAAELKCRLLNDSGSKLTLPTCVAGLHGVKAGAKAAVDARTGDVVRLPLYDSLGCPLSGGCGGSFHLVRFGCARVIGWEHQFELQPKEPGYKKMKSKVIIVEKSCDSNCMTSCGSSDGTLPQPWEVRAVGLVE
jgi:hypothetical protein